MFLPGSRAIRRSLGGVGVLVLCLVAFWFLAPRERPDWSPEVSADLSDPDAFLATREGVFPDVTEGAEARIIWAGDPGQVTEFSVLYLHGFTATLEEIRPVPDQIAAALGANLVFSRLRGHGRGPDALEVARAGEWLEDTALFLELARQVGRRVLVVSNSTGGTLGAIAMTEPDMAENVAAQIMISPNFGLTHPALRLMQGPLARQWISWIAGDRHCLETVSDSHARYFTTCIPSRAGVSVGTTLNELNLRSFEAVSVPVLVIYAEEDNVVSPVATREFATRWGGEMTLALQTLPESGVDSYSHVIAGEILSPAMTEQVMAVILSWVADQNL